ncbi:MAG: peptidase [Gemmatimonadetes bacterium]|nr:peptidase [Gemmatimonadota bacterium]
MRPISIPPCLRRLAIAAMALVPPLNAQGRITTPREALGHDFGDDYFLANYRQISDYWARLDRESDRMVVREIGKTAEGRPHLMAIVTSPENHRRIDHYRSIAQRLAKAEGLTDDEARALARDGKAVVWIDGGLHASETLGAQQLGEMVYQMVSRDDEETRRLLDDVIILFVHANPDGNDLVADWYMRRSEPTQRTLAGIPRLYQKYIGHDNNRDFFASTQAETENINRVLYHEWFPQVLYNHHQSGPAGTVVWSPPLRDPYNYNLDPIMVLGFQSLGAAMHTRLAVEGKPGATMRSGGPYDGWWNGGIRNTAAFHNTIALLTEMIGSPTPMRIPFVAQRQLPGADLAYPIPPGPWHLRQSVDYSVSLNRAVLDYASRMRENLLFGIYRMGRNSIERGGRDTWTTNPKRLATAAQRLSGGGTQGEAAAWAELRRPELRDPRGYIIPANQPDFPTATKFINALRETGIAILRARSNFAVQGKEYPAGTFVVKTAQAFRPHVIDMFEAQVHPDVFPVPGGPPTPPYDNAGWTLAMQMGVQYDRMLEDFTGPFETVDAWNLPMPATTVVGDANATGYLLDRRVNNTAIAVNRLLAAGERVSQLTSAVTTGGVTWPAGTIHVRARKSTRGMLERVAREHGVPVTGTRARVASPMVPLRVPRIGLWDQYGGSMPSGWTRWILEQFEFPFARIFAQQLNAGPLGASFDALVFVDGAIPSGPPRQADVPIPDLPAEYRTHTGRVSVDTTLPRVREFVEGGGTVVAIGESAVNLAAFLKLPIEDHLAENGKPLPRTSFYSPGSLHRVRVDTTHAAAAGMPGMVDVFFDDSPVFKLSADAAARGVTPIAWFDTATPLRSGWAWGERYLQGGVAAVEARVGKGRVLLFGPQILWRAQPHGTFKFLFNALLVGAQRS